MTTHGTTTFSAQSIPNSGFTFAVKNIRVFHNEAKFHTEFVDSTVIYGRTGSGKSTLISGVIRFLRGFIDAGHSNADLVFLGNDRRNFENKDASRNNRQSDRYMTPVDRVAPMHARNMNAGDEPSVVTIWYFNFEYEIVIDFSGKDKPEPIILSEKLTQWPEPNSNPKGKVAPPLIILHRVKNSNSYLVNGKDHVMEQGKGWMSAARDFHTKFGKSKPQHPICSIVTMIQDFTIISNIDLHVIQSIGCRADHTYHFHQRGNNALTMAYGWIAERRFAGKIAWVKDTMRVLFPNYFWDVEFPKNGNLISCRFFPTAESTADTNYEGIHPKCASAGMLQALVLLIGLASAQSGTLVAIDDIGDKIDPETQIEMVNEMISYSLSNELALVFTTDNHDLAEHVRSIGELHEPRVKALRLVKSELSGGNLIMPMRAPTPAPIQVSGKRNKPAATTEELPVEQETDAVGEASAPD